MDKKDIEVYFGDIKSKSLESIVACLWCFLKIKFADIQLISLEHATCIIVIY